jgi:ankyrin repeat protein
MTDGMVFRRTRGWRFAHVALIGFGVLALSVLIARQFAGWLFDRGINPWWLVLFVAVALIPLARATMRRVAAQIELRRHGLRIIEGGVSTQSLDWTEIERIHHTGTHMDLIDARGQCMRVDNRFERFPELVDAIVRMAGAARASRHDVPVPQLPAVFARPARFYLATFLTMLLGVTLGAFFSAKLFASASIGLMLVAAGVLRTHHRIVIDRTSICTVRPFSSMVVPLRAVRQVHLAASNARPYVALQTSDEGEVVLQPVDSELIDLYDHVSHARASAARAVATGQVAVPAVESPPRLAFGAAGLALIAYVALLPIVTGAGLRRAALRGDAVGVERMLRLHVPVDARGWSGKTALYEAAKYGKQGVLELLLAAGAAVDAPARHTGFTPVHVAAEYGNVEALRRLLDAGGSVNRRSRHRYTPLAQMAWNAGPDDVEVAGILLDNGADITAASRHGWTPLHHAAGAENVKLLRYLIERGAPLELRTTDAGYTPLMLAAMDGLADAVVTLVRLGANMEARSEGGSTPLYQAAVNGHYDIVDGLLKLGARADIETHNGWTPTQAAASTGNTEVLRILLASGGDPNVATSQVGPPLYVAAQDGHASAVNMLLGAGADPNVTHDGKSAIEVARERAHEPVIRILERHNSASRSP